MNVLRELLRECHLWRMYPSYRLRWLVRERRRPLARKAFRLGGLEHRYLVHPYNHTWANERAVEVPVALRFLAGTAPTSTLEVGNVLSHYGNMRHTVVDMNEQCPFRPVINEDIVALKSPRSYDAIVSISTIEHVGWDETPPDAAKVGRAFCVLRSLIAPGGKALVTVPVGYNRFLDARLAEGAIAGVHCLCLKRISADNEWAETDMADALRCGYGEPFPNANAVIFIYLHGTAASHDGGGGAKPALAV